jgi:hypothetical protein
MCEKVNVYHSLKFVIALSLLYLTTGAAFSQQQSAMEVFKDPTGIPVSAEMPGGVRARLTPTSARFYLGSRTSTFLSNITFSPYLNFKGRYSASLKSNLYTNENRWNIQGDMRFSIYPEYIYGTKNNMYRNEKLLLNYKYVRFYQTVFRKIKPYFSVGVGYNLDYHMNINTVNDTIGFKKFTGYNYGTGINQNTLSSGITFNLLYDTRKSPIGPVPDAYANLIYRINPSFLGNSINTSNSLYLEARKYISFPERKKKVIALWSYARTAFNNNVPYLDLPSNGTDVYQKSGRGIDRSRYRGKSLLYLEGEYRRNVTMNGSLKYIVFANFTTTKNPVTGALTGPYSGLGAGLRIKFSKRSNTTIALDYGVSKGNSGVYFNLGEVF